MKICASTCSSRRKLGFLAIVASAVCGGLASPAALCGAESFADLAGMLSRRTEIPYVVPTDAAAQMDAATPYCYPAERPIWGDVLAMETYAGLTPWDSGGLVVWMRCDALPAMIGADLRRSWRQELADEETALPQRRTADFDMVDCAAEAALRRIADAYGCWILYTEAFRRDQRFLTLQGRNLSIDEALAKLVSVYGMECRRLGAVVLLGDPAPEAMDADLMGAQSADHGLYSTENADPGDGTEGRSNGRGGEVSTADAASKGVKIGGMGSGPLGFVLSELDTASGRDTDHGK